MSAPAGGGLGGAGGGQRPGEARRGRGGRAWRAGSLALLSAGCAADLGGGAGAEVARGHVLGFGRVAASTRLGSPLNDHGLLVGAAVESRAEAPGGSRFTGGVLVGAGYGPESIGGSRWGLEGFAEAGTPLRSTLFRGGDFYAGVGVNRPLRLFEARQIAELNDSTWVLMTRFELVPMGRYRLHVDHPGPGGARLRHDVGVGLALRLRTFSDLF
ncbi:MAG TPA: hypothetical protein VFS43_23100 [Polyangiaceae bacterium]|nr:hypothetical protein [Polyangiaceae bacterium]